MRLSLFIPWRRDSFQAADNGTAYIGRDFLRAAAQGLYLRTEGDGQRLFAAGGLIFGFRQRFVVRPDFIAAFNGHRDNRQACLKGNFGRPVLERAQYSVAGPGAFRMEQEKYKNGF